MREALRAHLQRDARSEMGGRGRRLRARRRHFCRQLCGGRRRLGGRAGRPAYPRLPAAPGAIAQGAAGAARGRERGLTVPPIPRPQEKGWNRTGSCPGNSFPVPLHSLQTTVWLRSLTRPVPLHVGQRRLFVGGSCLSIGNRLPNAIFNSFAWKAHDGGGALNTDAAPLIFRSPDRLKAAPLFGTLGQKDDQTEKDRAIRNLQADLIVSVLVEPHFLHSSEKCSWPLLNNIGLTRVMAISSPQAETCCRSRHFGRQPWRSHVISFRPR